MQRVSELVRFWRPILGLTTWELRVTFDEYTHQAVCKARPQYEEAEIAFNLRTIEPMNDHDLEDLVVHELCHCLSWRDTDDDELVTTHIARSVIRAYRAGRTV